AYRRYSRVAGIRALQEHQPAAVSGRIERPRVRSLPGGLSVVSAALRDGENELLSLVWFYRGPRGMQVARRQVAQLQQVGSAIVYGTPVRDERGWHMRSPDVSPSEPSDGLVDEGEMVPVYPLLSGVSAVQLQRWTEYA